MDRSGRMSALWTDPWGALVRVRQKRGRKLGHVEREQTGRPL